jgi:alkanesulfonate monooxygenase SsuD/methylene tetrahydromethanopterin reductase-like flavin-dependent oxidoreductase (luciferase family)
LALSQSTEYPHDYFEAPGLSAAADAVGGGRTSIERANPEDADLRGGVVGFMLAHEQFTVPQLVNIGAAASRSGFDLLATSDHFQPWEANEGHSGSAWVTIAAMGSQTGGSWMGTTVTCPTLRYNPAVVAEAFASLSHLYPGRVFLGVGSGEALNEQAGDRRMAKVAGALGSADRGDRRHSRTVDGSARRT